MKRIPHLTILLASYNGEKYIEEQLQSLISQSYENITIVVSDDSEGEGTYKIIKKYMTNGENIYYRKGPQAGFVENFISMVNDENLISDYYAFCDQDDIWHVDKVKNAITELENLDSNMPNLYCSRTKLVNESGSFIGYSPYFKKSPSFRNALVQNIAGGNTMVFNYTLKKIISSLPQKHCISHDWLAYLISTGCGGTTIYSGKADIDYRQHDTNLVGSNKGMFARIKRLSLLHNGEYRKWNCLHDDIIIKSKTIFKESNLESYELFFKARNKNIYQRIYYFFKCRVYRQSLLGNIALLLGIILKKV